MPVLDSQQRKALEDACTKGRRASEQAVRAALTSLSITAERPPGHLDEEERQLRRGLRAKARQLGDTGASLDLLVAECAYEQWHRLLFARFLAENNLLIHPDYRAPVTLEDCEELADSLREPDGWSVAARFAAEILPGIFRLDDPCVRLRLAPEGRIALETVVAGLPALVFTADDALGWVYQFWQKDQKDEVNASERKIGGSDLGPVTQLFTENYMVRFLLENSLGAWWAVRHPASPLLKDWEYLRFHAEGEPAGGQFDTWPDTAADVTVMDPCCGSGHFLVEAFSMLWHMRAEEEGLSLIEAQDAVLRDNLFGLELDPRCVQIAMFSVALTAWKASGGWRELPVPNIACSGIPVRAPAEEWKALGEADSALENALARLYILFRDANTLGSLIDPKRAVEISDSTQLQQSFDDVEWSQVLPVLDMALARESHDPATAVLGADAVGVARAASFLARRYVLVTTNVPYLLRRRQSQSLQDFIDRYLAEGRTDLGNAFVQRLLGLVEPGGSIGVVTQQGWLTLASFEPFRRLLLNKFRIPVVAILGERAFESNAAAGAFPVLTLIERSRPDGDHVVRAFDVSEARGTAAKAESLRQVEATPVNQLRQMDNPGARIELASAAGVARLTSYASSYQGTTTGDNARWCRSFWEIDDFGVWRRFQGTVTGSRPFGGRSTVLWWGDGGRTYEVNPQARLQGQSAWGKRGVLVSQMRELHATLYTGEVFDMNGAAIIPSSDDLLPALWRFCSSRDYHDAVRQLDRSIKVTNATLAQVPFDVERWKKVAEESGPLPEPWSEDASQWLFEGRPEIGTEALQVAVGRLLGYRWPGQQKSDDLDAFADEDGIVCLPSVGGEAPAADRLQKVLAQAFGSSWSPGKQKELLDATGSKKKNLSDWLRDDFFKQHCGLFGHRPFVWHVWDGGRDGFAALVNYHRLDRKTLEKLTYTYLGDWIERQRAEVRDEKPGAEARLAAASKLRSSLELILDGEPPYDIFVRWKSLAEQPIGWEPDINDGVRVNVRPFVEAGVLRSSFNIHWRKDRGKNPDGSERLNDLHFTTTEKRAARSGS